MSEALVLIDIQRDYFPGGRMPVDHAVEAAGKAGELLTFFRDTGRPVIHVQHLSTRPGATFFLPGTGGVEIHEGVRPAAGEEVITKHFPNAFRETPLGDRLRGRGIGTIVFCGMMSHMCIDATVRAAFDGGFECRVAHDACAARALAHGGVEVPASHVHAAYMAALGAVYADVGTTPEIIGGMAPR